MPESKFTPSQAEELAAAFAREGIDYLFIGKSGAILLGYPDFAELPRQRGASTAGVARAWLRTGFRPNDFDSERQ